VKQGCNRVRRIALAVGFFSFVVIGLVLADPVNRIKLLAWINGETFRAEMPLSYWLASLNSPDGNLRYKAILAVSHEKTAIPGLTRRLQDDIVLLRSMAALELAHFGADAKDAVPALVVLLKDEDRSCRQAARDALQQIDPTVLVSATSP
jgi:hypothetical protein